MDRNLKGAAYDLPQLLARSRQHPQQVRYRNDHMCSIPLVIALIALDIPHIVCTIRAERR